MFPCTCCIVLFGTHIPSLVRLPLLKKKEIGMGVCGNSISSSSCCQFSVSSPPLSRLLFPFFSSPQPPVPRPRPHAVHKKENINLCVSRISVPLSFFIHTEASHFSVLLLSMCPSFLSVSPLDFFSASLFPLRFHLPFSSLLPSSFPPCSLPS